MAIIATAGHVDHGKSSLIAALTGTNPDRLPDEKRRGMTLDLGFAFRAISDSQSLEFVDVPGHEDLVRTMIGGVWSADVLLLVVDVIEGLMPQTVEHLLIAELLGVNKVVVALNKIDLVTSDRLSKEHEVRDELARMNWASCSFVKTSASTGEGVSDLVRLLEQSVQPQMLASDGSLPRPRLFIDRVFVRSGIGTIVTGTLTDGPLHAGDDLCVVRDQRKVRVREIQHQGKSVSTLESGHRCAINLSSADALELRRGDELVISQDWWPATSFTADITVASESQGPIQFRGSNLLCIGTNSMSCRVLPDGMAKIAPGTTARSVIEIEEPLVLKPGDRFVLRDTGRNATVAGGVILVIDPPEPKWCTKPEYARRFGCNPPSTIGEMYISASEEQRIRERLEKLLDAQGSIGLALLTQIDRVVLSTMQNITIERDEARRKGRENSNELELLLRVRAAGVTGVVSASLDRDIARRLVNRGDFVECGGLTFEREFLYGLGSIISELLTAHSGGFSVSQLRERLGTTRKFAVPLAEALDHVGVSRRVGDVRVAGVMLKATQQPEQSSE
jgi:selenocysteine-specific elongation factor